MGPQDVIDFVRSLYGAGFVPLHEPTFTGNEKAYVLDAIESTFVSSVGRYVDRFEEMLGERTGAAGVVATVNGTAALHAALHVAAVGPGDLVLTQPLTFVATCNAIAHLGAEPVFVDVDEDTLGLSPAATAAWLEGHAARDDDGTCRHRESGRAIRAVVPMHTFGHPVRLDELAAVCEAWGLTLIEDAAESLGSSYRGRHTGTTGRYGVLSFNGNKTITTGGGGAVLCRSADDARRLKHLTTTAKVPHPFEFVHDEVAFNFRLPNLNAALGCAQLEELDAKLAAKRALAQRYRDFFAGTPWTFVAEPAEARSNYWLNAVLAPEREARDRLLEESNGQGVMTRPAWRLMPSLPMFAGAPRGDLPVAERAAALLVNLPSTPVGT